MIEAFELTKYFGKNCALDGLSFSLNEGDVVGLLGPNGSGKTTTMRLLSQYYQPDKGSIRLNGSLIDRSDLFEFGYMPEHSQLYKDMTVLEFLTFLMKVRKLSLLYSKDRLEFVLAVLSLESVLTAKIDTLSKGFQRRVALAAAIIHDPKILLLDEPTDGLDPNQKIEVRQLIRSLTKDRIIMISTHILEELDALCGRALVIQNGKLVANSTPFDLKKQSMFHKAITCMVNSVLTDEMKQYLELTYPDRVLYRSDSRFSIISLDFEVSIHELMHGHTRCGW